MAGGKRKPISIKDRPTQDENINSLHELFKMYSSEDGLLKSKIMTIIENMAEDLIIEMDERVKGIVFQQLMDAKSFSSEVGEGAFFVCKEKIVWEGPVFFEPGKWKVQKNNKRWVWKSGMRQKITEISE